MKYRADIDGLRALAVVPVVLYHVGVPGFAGGFVGVDIFFVISGYLICGMIDADIRNGSFSLGNFYKRRILRILPALFVMFLVTSILAYIYFLPAELIGYSKSSCQRHRLDFQRLFCADRRIFRCARPKPKPLLHTWSLSVEEQFYFIAPLLMLFVYRWVPKRAKLLFAVVAALSLAAAIAMSTRNLTFTFYLTPFRAWELALGAMLAVKFIPVPETAFWKNICGGAGLLLLFGVILLGSSSAPLLLMTSLACARRSAGDRFQRERGIDGRTTAVAAAFRRHRADILFALSVALAADRVSAHRHAVRRGIGSVDQADVDHAVGGARLSVVEAGRVAVPFDGAARHRRSPSSAAHRPRWLDVRAVRAGVRRERRAIPLSATRRAISAPILPTIRPPRSGPGAASYRPTASGSTPRPA